MIGTEMRKKSSEAVSNKRRSDQKTITDTAAIIALGMETPWKLGLLQKQYQLSLGNGDTNRKEDALHVLRRKLKETHLLLAKSWDLTFIVIIQIKIHNTRHSNWSKTKTPRTSCWITNVEECCILVGPSACPTCEEGMPEILPDRAMPRPSKSSEDWALLRFWPWAFSRTVDGDCDLLALIGAWRSLLTQCSKWIVWLGLELMEYLHILCNFWILDNAKELYYQIPRYYLLLGSDDFKRHIL